MYTYIPINKMKKKIRKSIYIAKKDKKINIYCFISCKLDQAYAKLGMQLGNGAQERAPF